jgi:hypothetical protein
MALRPLSVDADECPSCGQAIPAEGAVENTLGSCDTGQRAVEGGSADSAQR